MATRDPRVDRYIDQAEEFARPILRHLRDVVHAASPDIEEDIKWGTPYFMYHGMLCGMAAFTKHCAFDFWKDTLILPDDDRRDEAMGQFGRITSVADLPDREVIVGYVREAMRLNEDGIKVPRAKRSGSGDDPAMPDAFRVALEQSPEAGVAFARFSPGYRREYVEWIAEAKRETTRARRIATAVKWIAEGKPRNWKYMK